VGATGGVGLVFDPDCGPGLAPLAARMHVWVVDSPANRTAAEGVWSSPQPDARDRGVTVFDPRTMYAYS
jgi:hypothetical protein